MRGQNRRDLFLNHVLQLVFFIGFSLISLPAQPFGNYLTDFNNTYGTAGSRIDNCGLCHYDFSGGGTRTPFGEDFRNNNYSIVNIGLFDSDGDGFNNDQESSLSMLTSPGFSCLNITSAVNAPANLLTFADPANPGCVGTGLPPVANANGPYVAVNGNPISFSSVGSSDADGSIVSYYWNFGGVYGSSVEANPVFTFNVASESKINVTLTVIDNDGNSTSTMIQVIVLMAPNSPPVADAGLPVSGVVNTPAIFNGTASKDADGDLLYFNWEFGDGSTSFSNQPSHSFNRCGVYDVLLTVTDIHSLSNSSLVIATIASSGIDLPVPNAGGVANHYDGSVGSNVMFDGTASYDTDCNVVSYNWNFGDGTTGSGDKPVHSYSFAGDYVVSLTVTDNDGLNATATATVTINNAGPLDGSALYATNCAACHGVSTNSNKAGATVARINTGITSVASMNSLATILSAAEIQAIADFLATLAPPPPPTTTDGAALYASSCAACHGATTSSTKIGATVTRINTGITSVSSMNSLSSLSVAQIQAIADYLGTLTAPPPTTVDGASLYASSCAACHGATTSSTKIGATVARINTGITSVSSMNSLSSLSVAQIQAIADYLGTLTAPPPTTVDGASLYASSCAACHGATTSSTKIGATVTRINTGITSVAAMNSLSSLSAAEVQAIADYLGTLTAPPPPTTVDGATLYATNCAACHGATASSTKIGATVARINTGIASVGSMNYLSSLSAAEVQAIADYLGTLGTQPPSGGGTVAHTDFKDGVGHAIDKDSPFSSGCTSCHGTSLQGAIGPSCTSCHDVKWNESGSSGGGSTVSHSDDQEGVGHAIDKDSPFSSGCTSCHGSSLQGAIGPSCTSCHDVKWNESGSSGGGSAVSHSDDQEGVGHAIDKDSPFSSGCTSCHGSSLQGAIGPSCTSCHDVKWNESGSSGGGSTVPHTDIKDGVGHAIDKDSPYSSGCTSCHGTSLQGVIGPSCTSCHDVKWNESAPSGGGGGSTVPHTDIKDGVGHAIDKDSPYSSSCTSCHGTSLQGAIGPSCTSCHDVKWNETAPSGGGSGPLNGETLYTSYCAACHGPSTNSTKTGAGVTRINNGIASVSSMNSLASLSSAQIQAIADFLTGSTTPPPTTTDGATLYANSCASCHGAGTSSTKAGASVTRIVGGITGITSVASMNSLSSMTVAQVQAISDYLVSMGSSTPPPTTTTGSTLYETSCAACHGSGTSSTKIGATVLRINTGITSVTSMNYLSSMSAAEIQAVSDYLVSLSTTTPPPTTPTGGATLYTNNCAACHGPGDSSAKAGATVSRINAGIASASSMNYLSTVLSTADIQALADYLATTPSSGGGTTVAHTDYKDGVGHAVDKDAPFSSGCTSCHGSSLQGAIGPSCTSCHDVKWNETAPSGGGSVAHTDYKDGVGHAIDKDSPFSSGCTSCHGTSLQGAIGPSCTSCHDVKWNESGSSGSDGDDD